MKTRKTQWLYLPGALVLHAQDAADRLATIYKEKHVEITVGLVMAVTWLAGFLLGAMFMAGALGL